MTAQTPVNTLAISPDETLIGTATGTRLVLWATDTRRRRETECAEPISALAAADGELWAACGGDSVRLRRFDTSGNPTGATLELGPIGAADLRFSNRSVDRFGTVLLGDAPVSLRPDCGSLDAAALRPAPQFAAPIGEGTWLIVSGGVLAIAGDAGVRELAAAPLLSAEQTVSAVTPLDDEQIAIFVAGADAGLWIIDPRRGEVRRRIPTPGGERAAIAAERGHALVLGNGGESLSLFDLRFGRPIATHRCTPPLSDVVVGSQSQRVAALRATESGVELVCADYRALLRGKTIVWAAPDMPARQAPTTPIAREPREPGKRREKPLPLAAGAADPGASAANPLQDLNDAPLTDDASIVAVDEATDEELAPPPIPTRLGAFEPKPVPAVASGEFALRALERQLALVASWVHRAIAKGWDSGRLAFASGGLPFEGEVRALLGAQAGLAADQLAHATLEAAEIATAHDQEFTRDLDACGGAEAVGAISPLAALCHQFGLSRLEADVLLVVAAPAVWGELARLYGICANDEDRPLCDEWLIAQILGPERAGRREIASALDASAKLSASGLVRIGTGRRPFASLSAHPLVVRRLFGETFATDEGDELVTAIAAPRPWSEHLYNADLADLFRALAPPREALRLVVRGRRGSGRRALIASLAGSVDRRVGLINYRETTGESSMAEALRRCALRGWLPCIDLEDDATERDPSELRRARELFAAHRGPLIFRWPRKSAPPLAPGYLEIELDELDERMRVAAFRKALARRGLDTAPAARFAALYTFGPGTIERIARRADDARGAGKLEDRKDVATALEEGIRQIRAGGSTLAQRVERLPQWSQLCLPDELLDSVREFIGRVRHRRTVFDKWGFDRIMTSSRGITALFEGRPGTGKTMVAGAIARELGCDLYRVDLSSVMSKWIGETEKHLAEVFDAAEGGQMILLFDEADSLFGKRTEVKSSNDRFANIEVNYLLQRLDTFTGIAILTTNFGRSIDPAFKRRLSLRLNFPFPDEDMRERLWHAHLPPELPKADDLELGELARRFKLSGGYIRNISLRAAFLAAHEGRPLSQGHLERAVSLEYRATGKLSDGGVLE